MLEQDLTLLLIEDVDVRFHAHEQIHVPVVEEDILVRDGIHCLHKILKQQVKYIRNDLVSLYLLDAFISTLALLLFCSRFILSLGN